MFSHSNSPASAYAKVGIETAVLNNNPHELILLLFQGARAAIVEAREHINNKNVAGKGSRISKAIDIIQNGLRASLDLKAGGELAERLSALYEYMCRRLIQANIQNNVDIIDEVLRLLDEIGGAWAEIGNRQEDAGNAAP